MAVTTTTVQDDAQRIRIRYVHVEPGTQGPQDSQEIGRIAQDIWNRQVQAGTHAQHLKYVDNNGNSQGEAIIELNFTP